MISSLLIIGYLVFPFDVIPDFLVAIGIVDDLAFLSFILQHIVKIAPHSLKEKHGLLAEHSKKVK
ncbi:YkvA family protein [Aquibacillus salsiterrae]|uniref:YkvA family protein n=1 Tax=Aquibacillus salsiterrae TaxID=2950439 RepID=UPI002FEE3557